MLFNSMDFLLFFPIVVLVCFIIPLKMKNIWLLVASYYFYMCWNAKYALLMFFSTMITYICGIMIEKIKQKDRGIVRRTKYKKIILAIGFVLNLGVLFYFKYINFTLDILRQILKFAHIEIKIQAFDIILPVGISFYIFQALGYIVDVYRNEIYAEKNFFRYALFVSFFPQLVAGPIERSQNLLKQLAKTMKFDAEKARGGGLLILWGFFLKLVIADRCAVLVNTVYESYASYRGFQLIIANILFAFQIYCDFMAYSVIAKGAAEVLGYELMDNFCQPYLAQSIKDFWRRWHISLSSWFRDYLYIPLGGNRGTRCMKYRNLLITFMVSGLWHGADITFVIWGGMHGLYQITGEYMSVLSDRICEKLHFNRQNFSWKLIRVLKTFILTDIAWVFFRSDTPHMALDILRSSFDLSNTGLLLNGGLSQLGLDGRNMSILILGLVVLAVNSVMKERGCMVREWLLEQNIIFRFSAYWGALLLIIFSLDIVGQEFIYFQF